METNNKTPIVFILEHFFCNLPLTISADLEIEQLFENGRST